MRAPLASVAWLLSAADDTDWVVLVCCRVVVLIALLLVFLALRLLRSRAYAPPLA
jgi:hypothetical protein